MRPRKLILLTAIVAMLAALGTKSAAADEPGPGWVPDDLARGWGDAEACSVGGREVRCWTSEEAMDLWVAEHVDLLAALPLAVRDDGMRSTSATCSSWFKIYDHANFGGRVLQFRDRGLWQNLSPYGFNNRTSSWSVGGCSVRMAKGTGGGGGQLYQPAWAAANASSSWNNVISSIKVN